jgi:signal transduction histidine kinase
MKTYFLTLVFLILWSSFSFGLKASDIAVKFQQKQDSIPYKLYRVADSLYKAKAYELALKKSFNVLDHPETSKYSLLMANTHYLLGKIWYNTNVYDKSVRSFKQSLTRLSEIVKVNDSAISQYKYLYNYYRIGLAYHRMYSGKLGKSQNENFVFSQNDSIDLMRYRDSSLYYFNEILKTNSLEPKIPKLKSMVYGNISGVYIYEKEYDKAEEYALKSLELKQAINEGEYSIAVAYNAVANVYYTKEEYTKAKDFVLKGLELIEGLQEERTDKLKAQLYQNAAFFMSLSKDIQAYDYLQKAWHLTIRIDQTEREKELAAIASERNFEKGVQEGIFQEELNKQRMVRNSWILGISLVSVIIFLGFLLNQNRLRRKNLRLALSQKETESQMQVLNANLIGQEEERKRISQELHDGVLGRLFGSRMGLGYLELDGDPQTQEQYQEFLEELQNIEKDIREVSHQLSSDISLSETSFLNAVNQLLKEKSKLGNFEFQLKMDDGFSWKDLDGVLEMNLFRILQESLQNIIKHAQAKHVFVSFKVENQELYFSVKDDGVGFDPSQKVKGIGLKNIQSRVENMKGFLEFITDNKIGTEINIRVPIS